MEVAPDRLNGIIKADYDRWIAIIREADSICAVLNLTRAITTPREHTAHWTKMRRSRARFSGSVASCRMPWFGGLHFITSTPESDF